MKPLTLEVRNAAGGLKGTIEYLPLCDGAAVLFNNKTTLPTAKAAGYAVDDEETIRVHYADSSTVQLLSNKVVLVGRKEVLDQFRETFFIPLVRCSVCNMYCAPYDFGPPAVCPTCWQFRQENGYYEDV